MSTECENLANCGFFKKYSETKNLACQGFINMFCKGEHQNECKRKAYKKEKGTAPADNMMPNGLTINE